MRFKSNFRAIKGAVPLKRGDDHPATGQLVQFPRHQRRGPIEALRLSARRRGLRNFRAIKGAVPLKPGIAGAISIAAVDFRAIKGAVPLKRIARLLRWAVECEFPRHQRRGPIEARCCLRGGGLCHTISAPSKARSH